ncbi:hypothetical protein BaRGS_00003284 [Batillaria attramentaria]|uniref:CHCH domain-containing protein n=1 Tax=Batillaria attramentaria TaxID=370345 RepID=A0ABD0M2J7_9CAEN
MMAAGMKHDRTRKPASESEEDPVENMISKTGCLQLHYAVQECMAEHQDWRKCQNQVVQFKQCMDESLKQAKTKKS